MLTDEQIELNKNRFIDLLDKIDREGFNKDKLVDKLNNSDFFIAPASTKYHCSFDGGLVQHCLNVYDSLVKLVDSFNLNVNNNSIIICSLFHDFSKMNYYDKVFQNKKVYSENGSKFDAGGHYDWVTVPGYVTKDANERFIYGSHEQTAEFMTRSLIPITVEESSAILHHMGGQGWDSAKDDLSGVYSRYPMALLLHIADMISTYYIEDYLNFD